MNPIKLLAFDADDTLWDNQTHFDQAEKAYCDILAPYGTHEEISDTLFATESDNMPILGYGCKAFTISLIENAIKISQGQITATDLLRIVETGKHLLTLPAHPLPDVEDTLRTLKARQQYKMVVLTKGELLDQENKLKRSGLAQWFDDIIVVSDKTQHEYLKVCRLYDTDISHMLMVGNSFKSDIEPVLQLGGYAVHIPFHTTWKHEQAVEYEHPHLRRITRFAQLADIL